MRAPDAIVVGSGPNGLAAAVILAEAGLAVLVRERDEGVGGGARTLPLTLPGYLHDRCSAIHPLAAASPLFRRLNLDGGTLGPPSPSARGTSRPPEPPARSGAGSSACPCARNPEAYGVRWVNPPAALAHPFDDGTAALLVPSMAATVEQLGFDGRAWRGLFEPLARSFEPLMDETLGALVHLPRRPLLLARFGLSALLSAHGLAEARFRGVRARALFAGLAAHANLPLERSPSAAFGLVLGAAAHAVGWPFPEGGAGRISHALAERLRERGGAIETDAEVRTLSDLPTARAVILDLTPRQVLRVAGERLPPGYRRALARFRYGPGAFKVDYALAAPIPWRASDCALAGTVHLGGTLEEIAAAERAVAAGRMSERPFVLLAQHTLFDPSRAPPGRHTAWAYCHVPHGWAGDATAAIEAQIERFAPGFREIVLARATRGPAELERENPNLVGGDVGGGENSLAQVAFRPAVRAVPWSTPVPGLYLCSASTPPGGGVHGMCGFHAARAALAYLGLSAGREPLRTRPRP